MKGNPLFETRAFSLEIGKCERQEEYEQLVQEHQKLYTGWSDKIRPLMIDKGLTAAQVAQGCEVSESTAASFVRKIPAKRENVIMLALMLGLDLPQTNHLLTRWAKFQELYAKNPEDAIWIYLLRKGSTQTPAQDFQRYFDRYQELYQAYCDEQAPKDKDDTMKTHFALHKLLTVQDDQEFMQQMQALIPSFEQGYQQLIDYVDQVMEGLGENLNTLFENNPSCRSRYYTQWRNLRKKRKLPSREYLVALGLHLQLSSDQINHLLHLAGMGPLCPKDRLEGAIVFYLEELYCQFPSMFYPLSQLEVMDYEGQQETEKGPSVSEHILLGEDWLPKEDFAEYVRRRLEETNISLGDSKMVERFLQLL